MFEKKAELNFAKTCGEMGRINEKIMTMSQTMETLKTEVKNNDDKATDRSVRMEDRLVMLEK